MTSTQRIGILAGVVVLLGGVYAHDRLTSGRSPASATTAPASTATATSWLAPGAPEGWDKEALQKRYQPVVAARPFAVRSFKPAPPPRDPPKPREPRGPDPRPERNEPEPLELLVAGTMGTQAGRIVCLEHRSSGRGLLLRAGDKLGAGTVTEVETAALVIKEGERTRRVELGELVSLPQSEERALQPIKTTTSAPPPVSGGSSQAPAAPPPNPEERNKLLEQLKERRRQSLDGQAPGGK